MNVCVENVQEDMKTMPRVVTFLQLVSMSGSHTTYPNEQMEKAAKRQPPVSNTSLSGLK